jgi:hypothetical protein
MGNQWNNPVVIADKMLEFFEGLSEIAGVVNRDYQSNFQLSKESIGQTLYVEKPPRYLSQDGPVISSVQDINKQKVAVIINKWRTVPIKLTGLDLTFNAKQFDIWAERELKPIVSPLANDVDKDLFALYDQIYNHVGTPGTGFGATANSAYDLMAAARELLTFMNTPQEDRVCFVNPTGSRKLTGGLATGFNPQGEIGGAVKSGKPFHIAGFDTYEANNVAAHTRGTATSTGANILTDGSNQVGNTLHIDAWTTGTTLKKGDVITVEGVYSVVPTSKVSTGILQEFVVTEDATAADNEGDIKISPAIIPSGAFQNVSNAAADGKIITIKTGNASTSYAQQLAFWKKALGLVTVPIKAPKGLNSVTRSYKGMSITISYGADIYNFEEIWRADIAYGVTCFYAENAVRISN